MTDLTQSACLLSTAYLGPIQYYSKLVHYREIQVEHYEHFQKQTYRNRCTIYSPNGLLPLSIPLKNRHDKTLSKDIRIDQDSRWQLLHWRSLEAAYRNSPYFEFYEHAFAPLYREKKFEYLFDLNEAFQEQVCTLLRITPTLRATITYEKYPQGHIKDFRQLISPKTPYTEDRQFRQERYFQTFETKCGFIPNLSILDLLFNEGPHALQVLKNTIVG